MHGRASSPIAVPVLSMVRGEAARARAIRRVVTDPRPRGSGADRAAARTGQRRGSGSADPAAPARRADPALQCSVAAGVGHDGAGVILAVVPPSSRKEQVLGGWHDAETGLFGPRAWSRILAAESARQRRHAGVATVVVVELPWSDEATGGSRARKAALTATAGLLDSMARTSDLVARTGPSRFAVLLPETDEVAAVNFVERVRPRCDAALAPVDPVVRCRFGWADANASRSLEDAAELAISRLASDR